MTKKDFWRSASNWGMIVGAALFVVSLISWGLKFEANKMGWPVELMHFAVICPAILYTGFRNAQLSGPEGYPYGRAVGYIFAMLMFAGIVYGVGRFLMVNFIARDYYDAINAEAVQALAQAYQGSPMYDQMISISRWITNPIVLIVAGVIEMVCKGGVLGLVLAAFFTKKPDLFATAGPAPSCPSRDE
jgi:cytochrome c oxidase assembly factor CtaG